MVYKFFLRLSFLFFWLGVIALFLYGPLLTVSKTRRSINILVWSGIFDIEKITEFEDKNNIKVNMGFYESNEELLVKLRATSGQTYDLIIPSDYAVNALRKEGLLKKLDKSKMPFFSNLNPMLLGYYYDPDNNYSIPAEWGIFGLGINKDFFKQTPPERSWSLAFDPKIMPTKIIMTNEFLAPALIAYLYLYGPLTVNSIGLKEITEIQKLLKFQRNYVEAYTDFRPDYYLSTGNSSTAVASSAYIWRSIREHDNLDFILPKEGSLITIENYAIPKGSDKEDLVYEFLDYMLNSKIVTHHFNEYALLPVTLDVLPELIKTVKSPNIIKMLSFTPEEFKKFHLMRYDYFKEPIDEQFLQNLWLSVKA